MGKQINFPVRAVAFLAIGILFSGCTPSTSQIISMREDNWAWSAKGNYKTVLKYLQGESGSTHKTASAAWRIEAIRTLCHIDRKFAYSASEPSLHRQTLNAVRGEYQRPGSSGETDRVRAWSIRLLGEITPKLPVSYFVDALVENSPRNDRDYRVSLAALGALYPHMDTLADDPVLKRKVLYGLARITSGLDSSHVQGGRRKEALNAANCFQQRLRSYPAIVDLLSAGASGDDIHALLEILKWNYQQLKIGAHRNSSGANSELLDENINMLLGLAWHETPGVRSRCRLILAEFAPGVLFNAVIKRVSGEGRIAPEDYRQLAALMVKFSGDDYRPRRLKAIAALCTAHPNIPVNQREVVYGQLLSNYPSDLRDALLAANARVLEESQQSGLQHIRYLEHLRAAPAGSDKAIDHIIDTAVAAFMCHRSVSVKRQVAASLAGRKPVLLARSCLPAITAISGESTDSAKYLADVYMNTLADIESRNGLKDLKKAMGKQDPYELLSGCIDRPEYSIRAGIAAFLCSRNCDLLVNMLSQSIKQTSGSKPAGDIRHWRLLGDIIQKHRKELTKQSLASASAVLVAALGSSDPERRILCCRYLLELGYDLSKIVELNADLAAMVSMASEKARDNNGK